MLKMLYRLAIFKVLQIFQCHTLYMQCVCESSSMKQGVVMKKSFGALA